MKSTWKPTKKLVALMLALVLALSVSAPVLAARSLIEKVEYEGKGKVEVDFYGRVQYKNPAVTVKDADGKTYRARITDRDSDDLEFKVTGLKGGMTYRFTISGIRQRGASSYTSYSGKFAVPAELSASKMIKKVEYEGRGKVEVEFRGKVQYKRVKVTVQDAQGKTYAAKILDKDNDDLEFRVTGLKSGETYSFTISGIRKRGAKAYTSYRGEFIASRSYYDRDDDDD